MATGDGNRATWLAAVVAMVAVVAAIMARVSKPPHPGVGGGHPIPLFRILRGGGGSSPCSSGGGSRGETGEGRVYDGSVGAGVEL